MAELVLGVPIDVKITDGGKVVQTLHVTYRYPTKKEDKEFKELIKKIGELEEKTKKLLREHEHLTKKQRYAEELGEFEKAEKLQAKIEKVEKELDKTIEELKEYGGEEREEFLAKRAFELFVGGEDVEKLREYAEMMSYRKIIDLLTKERTKIEKKQLSA